MTDGISRSCEVGLSLKQYGISSTSSPFDLTRISSEREYALSSISIPSRIFFGNAMKPDTGSFTFLTLSPCLAIPAAPIPRISFLMTFQSRISFGVSRGDYHTFAVFHNQVHHLWENIRRVGEIIIHNYHVFAVGYIIAPNTAVTFDLGTPVLTTFMQILPFLFLLACRSAIRSNINLFRSVEPSSSCGTSDRFSTSNISVR